MPERKKPRLRNSTERFWEQADYCLSLVIDSIVVIVFVLLSCLVGWVTERFKLAGINALAMHCIEYALLVSAVFVPMKSTLQEMGLWKKGRDNEDS